MIVSETEKPEVEKMPGWIWSCERDTDPFNSAVNGWMYLDHWGNPVLFVADGTEIPE